MDAAQKDVNSVFLKKIAHIAFIFSVAICSYSVAQMDETELEDMTFYEGIVGEFVEHEPAERLVEKSFLRLHLIEPSRVTLSHELGYKVADPTGFIKNRSAIRWEYAKHFLDNYFVQLDVKSTLFHGGDHRRNVETSFSRINQAYIQTSFNNTSLKFGLHSVVWGESILAPVTDEVNPRDNRELFNFNLDELRIAQPMISLEHFSDFGKWGFFINLDPDFNDLPRPGSEFFFDPFGGEFILMQPDDEDSVEFGGSWKKTFGNLDLSVVSASLIDNDYALNLESPGVISQNWHRYFLGGMTFSYVVDNFIWKGEFGYKSNQAFNNLEFKLIERDVLDTYFGFEYRPSNSLTLSLDVVNQHVADWSDEILGIQENQQSIMLNINKLLMRDDLSLGFIGIYNRPRRSHLGLLQTEYQINDNLTAQLNFAYPHSDDDGSVFDPVSDQKQLTFKIAYQF